jgi:hypothetical protein
MHGAASTAVHKDAASAAANPYMACVHEDKPHPQRCCSSCAWNRRTKLVLAMVTAVIIVAGVALGLGIGLSLGLQKGKGGYPRGSWITLAARRSSET